MDTPPIAQRDSQTHPTRDFIVIFLHTVLALILMGYLARNEDRFDGDLEWAIFYGALFISSLVSGALVSIRKNNLAVVWMSCLVPWIAPSMFILVSAMLCFGASSIGVSFGVGLREALIRVGIGQNGAEQSVPPKSDRAGG